MYVIAGCRGRARATLVWLSADGVHQAVLTQAEATPAAPGASASPGASGAPSPSGPRPSGARLASALATGAARATVIPLRDANPTRRTPVVTLAPHRGLLRRSSLSS